MSKMDLRSIIQKKEISSLIDTFAALSATPVAVIDAASDPIRGVLEERCARRYPIELNGKVLGWVVGDESACVLASMISIAAIKDSEKDSLSRETLNRYRDLANLYEFSEKVTFSLASSEIAATAIKQVVKSVYATGAAVLLGNGKQDMLRTAAAHGEECHLQMSADGKGGAAGLLLRTEKGEIINDLSSDPRFGKQAEGVHALMYAPLICKDMTLGCLTVSSKNPYSYRAEDLKILKSIAAQTAIALSNAQMYEQLRADAEELKNKNERLEEEINRRTQMEKALLASEEKYRLHFEHAADVIYSVGEDFTIAYVSPSVTRHLGYMPEELMGKPFSELSLLTEESRSRAISDTLRIFAGETLASAEYEIIAKDGSTKIAEVRSVPIRKDNKITSIVSVARDITAQRKTEEALAASEKRFRTMAENITSGLIIMEEGTMVYANDRACQICGYPRDELITLWGPDLAAPQSAEEKHQILHEIRETGVYPEQVDTWITRKDGTQCCLNLRFSFAYSSERKQTGYVIITDITQQRLVEEEIRKTSDFLDNVIENSLDPIVIGDSLGNITRINKAFVQLVGFNQEELIGKHLAELVPPRAGQYQSTDGTVVMVDESFYNRAYKQMGTMIEKGYLSSWESFYFKKDGTVVPVEQTMFYLYDKKGSRIGVVTINRDISERKKAERKLIETRNFLGDIIRTSADGIVVTDTWGIITLVNDAVERIVGFSQEDLVGKNIHDFMIQPDERLRGDYAESPSNGTDSVFFFESKWKGNDGREIDLGMSVGALKDVTGSTTGMVACIRDITERKVAERKLYDYQNQLRCLASQLTLTEEQERKHIASEIHDRIAQSLALAKIKLGALGAAVKTGDKRNDVAAIRSLLEQSIKDTRSLIFDLSPPFLYEFGLEKALEWLLEDMERQYGIKTHLTYHGNQGSYDDDVRILLYQSIRELLINIVKHAQANTATVSLDRNTQKVHVSVEDDGRGFLMSPDGFQMNKSGGYGIFSIRERFRHLGGEIRVESRLRHGTRIDLELPLVQQRA